MKILKVLCENGKLFYFNSLRGTVSGKDRSLYLKGTDIVSEEVVDYSQYGKYLPNYSYIKYLLALDHINQIGVYDLGHSSLRVADYVYHKDLAFIVVVYIKGADRYYIETTRNAVNLLYKLTQQGKGPAEFITDLSRSSYKCLTYGPLDNKLHQITRTLTGIYEKLGITKDNYLSKLYKPILYEQLYQVGGGVKARPTDLLLPPRRSLL